MSHHEDDETRPTSEDEAAANEHAEQEKVLKKAQKTVKRTNRLQAIQHILQKDS